uniref:NAC domain-containing protein n=1 Tax=Oryza barthii TaxID=65489 RepID=A0A0D3H6T3_9ORYZ
MAGGGGGDRAPSSSSTAMISRLLPPGFRFRPTDGELVAHYLARKAADAGFTSAAIRDADLYRAEPWDLLPSPRCDAAAAEEEEEEERCGYFFCTRSFRWPSGTRTNRATAAGYWKSTGKDKAVLHGGGGRPVGVKKTLVFYRGRAPRGEKTSWVMHEYRLLHGGAAATASSSLTPRTVVARSEWVICRVFVRKTPDGNNDRGTTEHHLPSDDAHLRSSPAPANSVDGAGHASCSFFSGANESMAPSDHFNIGDDMILHGHDEEELLMMNCSSAFDLPELLAGPLIQRAMACSKI